jgi:O-antigen ligase
LAIVLIWVLVLLFGFGTPLNPLLPEQLLPKPLLPEPYRVIRVESLNLYRNTICFGMGLVLWVGLWICVPFCSKDIPLVRRFLPLSFLLGMKEAARISPIDLLLFPFRKRNYALTFYFALLRWGVVCFVCYYLFWINPSRTAQMSFLASVSIILLSWNWKKGCLLAFILCVSIISAAHFFSPIFEHKTTRTINDVKEFLSDILNQTDTFQSHDRLMLWKEIFPSICEKPIFGYGMQEGREEVKTKISTHRVDPHNEFINITLEFGSVGLTGFLLWLVFFFHRFRNGILPWRYLGLFLVTALTIDCLYNGALSYNRESHLFCVLIGILYVTDKKIDN